MKSFPVPVYTFPEPALTTRPRPSLDPDETALQPALRVGRDPGNDIVLDDPRVSRHHLELTRAGDGWWLVRDLGSWNGTYLNGRRIDIASAADGDRLHLGGADLLVTEHGLHDGRTPAQVEVPRRGRGLPALAVGVPLAAALVVGFLNLLRP
jgi:pSer/pThr/pTyr-binding forkhead associated (FHA) protein